MIENSNGDDPASFGIGRRDLEKSCLGWRQKQGYGHMISLKN
jgi:hypothetical protein